jgi:hypothetical protein
MVYFTLITVKIRHKTGIFCPDKIVTNRYLCCTFAKNLKNLKFDNNEYICKR